MVEGFQLGSQRVLALIFVFFRCGVVASLFLKQADFGALFGVKIADWRGHHAEQGQVLMVVVDEIQKVHDHTDFHGLVILLAAVKIGGNPQL